jgi:imidazolonepropionase
MKEVTHFVGIRELLTMEPTLSTASDASNHPLGIIHDAAMVCDRLGRVAWVGSRVDLRPNQEATEVNLAASVVIPGLVDAHTHLVFDGDRTRDFADRCNGVPYEKIAERGGGIRLTVNATRQSSHDRLVELARPRLQSLLMHGATTVEIKSGYGLSFQDELKLLEVIARLDKEGPWRLIPTALPAHIIPDEFRNDRKGYIRLVTEEILPEVATRNLAQHVDVFCDVGAFTVDETRQILERAQGLGLGLKVHAEQLTHTGISGTAAELGAVSADHLEHISDADIDAMASAGTVAVLLPGAAIFLGESKRAPARRLLEAGVPVALATDCNPGTCPTTHLPLITTFGCTWLGLSPQEALNSVTRHAGTALGLGDGTGTLRPGAPCDFVICDIPAWQHFSYRFAHNPVEQVHIAGKLVYRKPEMLGAFHP